MYQQGTITLLNSTNAVVYVGGLAIQPGATASIALNAAQTSTSLLQDLLTGALQIVNQVPGYEWGATPTYQAPVVTPWISDQQLSGEYTIPTQPYWGLFSGGRVWVNPHGGEVTLTLNTSPDNGLTWYPLTDWATQGQWTVSGTPQQLPLPGGIPQLQGILTPASGTTPTVSVALSAY